MAFAGETVSIAARRNPETQAQATLVRVGVRNAAGSVHSSICRVEVCSLYVVPLRYVMAATHPFFKMLFFGAGFGTHVFCCCRICICDAKKTRPTLVN